MDIWISWIFGYHGYLDVMATWILGIYGYHLYSDILAIRLSWIGVSIKEGKEGFKSKNERRGVIKSKQDQVLWVWQQDCSVM